MLNPFRKSAKPFVETNAEKMPRLAEEIIDVVGDKQRFENQLQEMVSWCESESSEFGPKHHAEALLTEINKVLAVKVGKLTKQ